MPVVSGICTVLILVCTVRARGLSRVELGLSVPVGQGWLARKVVSTTTTTTPRYTSTVFKRMHTCPPVRTGPAVNFFPTPVTPELYCTYCGPPPRPAP
ncbi:hypothetical protein C7212DRAFT_317972 [Tuber magnatum]|uniref:Secreted protein n=1 Tax=Tuber magnatum TaxID=42249 RepID=A0A317SQ11_9PEZI|nr:hypothetical protein C7212DRAFT_317972 [Tuber magnatum]